MEENYGWLPKINMDAMLLLGQGIANRQLKRRIGSAMQPLAADDYVGQSKALLDMGLVNDAYKLGGGGDSGEKWYGNPQLSEDPSGNTNLNLFSNRGNVKTLPPPGGGQWTEGGQWLMGPNGPVWAPKRYNRSTYAPNGVPEEQPMDEPRETWELPGNPTNEYDPQVPELSTPEDPGDEVDAPEGFFPGSRLAPEGDFGPSKDVTDVGRSRRVEEEKAIGDIQGKAKMAIPAFENTVQKILGYLDKIEKSPDLDSVLGFFEGRQPGWMQTESQQEVQKYIDMVVAKEWTAAYEGLKGAGAITEQEGKAAQAAMSNLSKQAVGGESYRTSIKEARRDMLDLLRVLQKKAGLPQYKNPYRDDAPTPSSKAIPWQEWMGM